MRQLRPKLEAVHVAEVNGHPATNGVLDKSKIVKESEELLTRFDALDMNIDTWVEQVESASKQVKGFQVQSSIQQRFYFSSFHFYLTCYLKISHSISVLIAMTALS